MAPLTSHAARSLGDGPIDWNTKVFLLWFGDGDVISRQDDVQWVDERSTQPGLTEARAEIRLLLWDAAESRSADPSEPSGKSISFTFSVDEGDVATFQDALEALEPEPGVTLWVLSVDVMVSSTCCNLLKEDTQRRVLAGPPCETWSVARDPDDPGLHNPAKKKSPSIWKTALLEWFRQTGLFTELRLEQGFYHQGSPKPTRFLLSGVTSDVTHDFELRSRTSERPKAVSIGRDGVSFKTAKLKECTPQLCAMIAQLYAHRLRPQCEALDEAPDEYEWMRSLAVSNYEHEPHGPDFAGAVQT